ncbi:MAG: universal stress protein [Bradyrhizobiaceae bacterium]|nr:universal stress protein [Bradyrhizobiaceae bacterium]
MAPHRLAKGQIVDGFRLDAPLDAGGMASFWRVSRATAGGEPADTDAGAGTDSAPFPMLMKIPLLRHGEDPLTIVGFEVEQMILARLSGPHVPRFVAAGDFEQPYIVMEFVPGRPLKAFVREAPLPPGEVATIGARVAHALHEIHRQHVIHLDLKPSNVILRDVGMPAPGEAVLIDFGLSRHDQLPDLVAEEFGGAVGTGAYVAPEQTVGDRSDPRSDIFSLGVVLYLLATGRRPYGEPEREGAWRRRLWRDPQPPRRWNRDLPPWLQEIVLRCLEIDPADRYGSAAQLAFDLQHPADVPLTARSERKRHDGWPLTMMRWLRARDARQRRSASVAGQLSRAPIIMAAVDVSAEAEPLAQAVAAAVGRLLAAEPGARVTCVNVLKLSRLAIDPSEDEQGRNLHLRRLIELKHWARLLAASADRTTYHVLEAVDPAAAIVAFARTIQADHIVIGARGSSALRRYLGSVSAQVVATAPCTVTVVRPPLDPAPEQPRNTADRRSSGPFGQRH